MINDYQEEMKTLGTRLEELAKDGNWNNPFHECLPCKRVERWFDKYFGVYLLLVKIRHDSQIAKLIKRSYTFTLPVLTISIAIEKRFSVKLL